MQEESIQATVVRKALELLEKFITYSDQNRYKILRFYELLDLSEEEVETLKPNFLEDGVQNKDKVLNNVKKLYPERFIFAELDDEWGISMINGGLILSKIVEEISDVGVVRTMFTLLHAFAHKKKMLHMINDKHSYDSPASLKDELYSLKEGREEAKITTATFLEIYSFRVPTMLKLIGCSLAGRIVDFDGESRKEWDHFVNCLENLSKQGHAETKIGFSNTQKIKRIRPKCRHYLQDLYLEKMKKLEEIAKRKWRFDSASLLGV